MKRQHRDPHADWWDKVDRRNYGEPVHENHDVLGRFTPEDYTHFKPGRAFACFVSFWVAYAGLCGVVALTYPDRPHTMRTFEDGLEAELGGPKAVRVRFMEHLTLTELN